MAATLHPSRLTPAEVALVRCFRNGGCIRRPSEARCDVDGAAYKKGWELRFYVRADEDVEDVVDVVKAAGLRPGRPYAKGAGFVVPVYGRDVVERFEALLLRAG